MRNLILISIFLFSLYGCSLLLFEKNNNLHKISIPNKHIDTYFNNIDSSYIYKTEINFFKKYYSGISVFKPLGDSCTQVVFLTELGIKIFDFEIKNPLKFKKFYKVNYIIDPLNKKFIIKKICNDYGYLIQNAGVKYLTAFTNDSNTFLQFNQKLKKYYYIFFQNEKNYNSIKVNSAFKTKIDISFYGINKIVPDSIFLNHNGIKLTYKFLKIN